MASHNTAPSAEPQPTARVALPLGWGLASAAGAIAWLALVAASPRGFFAIAAPFCAVWIAVSARAAPPGLRARLAPRAADVAIGLGSGLVLYAGSRAFLWATCGPFTRALCAPLAGMFERFQTRDAWAALALALLLAPAEEVFWRGVLQGWLARRVGAVRAVIAATLVAAVGSLVTGEAFLALAMLTTYGAWGALAAWRKSLVPALVSHALWSVLVAVLVPPV